MLQVVGCSHISLCYCMFHYIAHCISNMNVILHVLWIGCNVAKIIERYSDSKTKACVNLKIREQGIGFFFSLYIHLFCMLHYFTVILHALVFSNYII
jgi:hypothetical protein